MWILSILKNRKQSNACNASRKYYICNIYQWPTGIIQFYIFWFQMKQINEQIDSKSGLENGVVDTGFNFHLKQLKKKRTK